MNKDPGAMENNVCAPLTFIQPADKKPLFHSSALTGGEPKIFFDLEERIVPINDMRSVAQNLSLDREGFELHHHHSEAGDLHDDASLDSRYFPEMEAYLRAMPEILDAAIVSYPDPRLTEIPVAFVLASGEEEVVPEDIIGRCKGRVASFKIPRHVIKLPEFPMTPSGKVRKIELRAKALDILGIPGTGQPRGG